MAAQRSWVHGCDPWRCFFSLLCNAHALVGSLPHLTVPSRTRPPPRRKSPKETATVLFKSAAGTEGAHVFPNNSSLPETLLVLDQT